ncbi:hypothetical protein KY285_023177 [Solanum tuberosum]|nr:hypothetical protein KY285_023177 [Solanum tuberosum]
MFSQRTNKLRCSQNLFQVDLLSCYVPRLASLIDLPSCGDILEIYLRVIINNTPSVPIYVTHFGFRDSNSEMCHINWDRGRRFETIANETTDVPDGLMLLLMSPEAVYEEVLKQTIQERRIQAEKGPIRPALTQSYPPRNFTTTSHVPSTSSPQSQNRQPLKRLSDAEIQSRHERGLCYYCEEKYTAGHKCKAPPQLLLLTDGSDNETTLPEQFASNDFLAGDLQCLDIQEHSALSYKALAGGNSLPLFDSLVYVGSGENNNTHTIHMTFNYKN